MSKLFGSRSTPDPVAAPARTAAAPAPDQEERKKVRRQGSLSPQSPTVLEKAEVLG